MSETEASTIDVQKLRRGLGDLAALSALPVIWTESDPGRIAESLADALLHMLHLELVYILVRDRAYESPVEVAHTARGPAPTAQAEEIGRALDPWLNTNDLSRIAPTIANPLGNGMTRIVCPPFGIEARGGVLVACSPRADFPSEVDRLLLGVAANQVAVLLDRRRTEDALRESEERFRGTFENAGAGIADCDPQGRFLRVNQRLCEIVGHTREELLQKTWQDITHPDDLAASLEQFLPLLRGEQPGYSLEKRCVRKDGSPVWIDLAVSLRRDAAGTPAYVIAILQDISERKRLEAELREAKEAAEAAGARVTRILESITDAFYALDRDWRFTYINPQAEPLLRRSRDELLGKVVWDEFPESVGSTFDRISHAALATGRAVTFEEYYPPLGTWFEVRAYPSADGLSVYFRDVTERRRAEEALRLANARLDLALRGSNISIVELNMPDGILQNGRWDWVSAGDQISGHDRSELATDFAATMPRVHPDDRERVERALRAYLSGQTREFEAEGRIRHKDG